MLKPKGIIPAMVTPLRKNGELNPEGIRPIVEHLVKGGVDGIFVVGSQGEFWALSADEKKTMFERTVDETNGRVAVYAGTGAESTREVVELNRVARDAGADAVSVITPYYVKPNSRELFNHYSTIASKTDLPILLYNNPGRTGGVNITPDLLNSLIEEHSNIVGIKESSGDMTVTSEFIRRCSPRATVLAGRDTMIYSTLAYGGKGSITATANVVPALVVQIYKAFMRGDYAAALGAQYKLAPLRIAFDLGTFPVVIKEAVNLIGLPAGPAREPILPMDDKSREDLKKILMEYDFTIE